MKLVRWNLLFLFVSVLFQCSSKLGSFDDWIGVLNSSDAPKVLVFSPASDSNNVEPKTNISVVFSKAMSIQTCVSAFSLDPPVRGSFETTELSLKYFPKTDLPSGGYVIRLTKQCEDKTGKDLDRVYTIPFRVGEKENPGSPMINSIMISTGTESECLLGGSFTNILLGGPEIVCSGVPGPSPIQVQFSKPMNQTEVGLGLRIEPAISYRLEWESPTLLTVLPDLNFLPETRYHILFPVGLHSLDGAELSEVVRSDFFVGPDLSDPEVIGFGLESQNCGLGIQELGSSAGGRWDSGFCFWSQGLPILSPNHYHFRGGDTGFGGPTTSSDCADVNTDNFRIFFDQYMDTTSVIGATRLSRISPPSTNIRLSTWVWSHCQTEFPFGCKQLTYSFAESEASCNGTLFGNISTGGDFNLSYSALAPNFYPYYEFRLDPDAKSISGKRMKFGFVIQVEAK